MKLQRSAKNSKQMFRPV